MNQFKCMKCSRIAGEPPVRCGDCGGSTEYSSVSMMNDPLKNTTEWRCKHGCGTTQGPAAPQCCGETMSFKVYQQGE